MSRRKVVVTGLGLITPIGLDGESTWRSLLEGRSGVARIQAFDPTEFRTQIAAKRSGRPPRPWPRRIRVRWIPAGRA